MRCTIGQIPLSISAPVILGVLMLLSSASASGGTSKETHAQIKDEVQAAINHAMEAKRAGEQDRSEALVKHAQMALDKAKEAQGAGPNQRLNDGIYALSDAIEHGNRKQTEDATEHVMRAIMKLSQAAGLQMPEHFQPARETGRQAASEGQPQNVSGEVMVKGEILRVERDDFYVVKDEAGKEVHLFVDPELNRKLNVGDRIEAEVDASGHITNLKQEQP